MEEENFQFPRNSKRRSGSLGSYSVNSPDSPKRDSGYLTDNSPFLGQHFTFEVPRRAAYARGAFGGSESDTAEGCSPFEPILLEDNEDDSAFRDSPFSPGPVCDSPYSPGPDSDLPDDDSSPVRIPRPRSNAFRHVEPAPALRQMALVGCSMPIPLRMTVNVPRTAIGRNVSTQTPHDHCQVFSQYLQTPMQLPVVARGPVHRRLRHHSEGEEPPATDSEVAPLPDIIPHPRDRSVSLPDVQAIRRQREIEMGRELRRISDEFDCTYRSRRRRLHTVAENFEGEAASFPGARPHHLTAMWTSLRNLVFGEPPRRDTEDPPEPS